MKTPLSCTVAAGALCGRVFPSSIPTDTDSTVLFLFHNLLVPVVDSNEHVRSFKILPYSNGGPILCHPVRTLFRRAGPVYGTVSIALFFRIRTDSAFTSRILSFHLGSLPTVPTISTP